MKNSSIILIAAWGLAAACSQSDRKEDTVVVGDDTYQVGWLFSESFGDGWEDRWVAECDSCFLRAENGKLYIDDYKGATVWNVDEYPENLIIRYKVKGLDREANQTNFNLFTHANEPDGSPLVIGKASRRSGVYKAYHVIPNYLTTFVHKWTRLRQNPGFNLLSDMPEASSVDTEYEIVFTVSQERLRYYINGVKFHDEPNENPLPGGKVGIRTWNTRAAWYDISIGELIEEE